MKSDSGLALYLYQGKGQHFFFFNPMTIQWKCCFPVSSVRINFLIMVCVRNKGYEQAFLSDVAFLTIWNSYKQNILSSRVPPLQLLRVLSSVNPADSAPSTPPRPPSLLPPFSTGDWGAQLDPRISAALDSIPFCLKWAVHILRTPSLICSASFFSDLCIPQRLEIGRCHSSFHTCHWKSNYTE